MHQQAPLLNQQQLIDVLNTSKTATAIYIGENAIIQFANDAMLSVWGKDRSVVGMFLHEAIPELVGQPFGELLAKVWREGITHIGTSAPADLVVDGKLSTFYFDFEYRAMKNQNGEVYCIINSAVDVTERVINQKIIDAARRNAKALEREQANNLLLTTEKYELESQVQLISKEALENAEQFKRLVEQAPFAIAVFEGLELKVDIVNAEMLSIWGKDESVLGLPLAKALPELEGQPFEEIIRNVLITGKPYVAQESRAMVMRNDELTDGYYNFVCKTIKGANGENKGVLQVVTDVTIQVEARLAMQRTQEMMDMAIDAANLGSWLIHPVTKDLRYNAALARMYGYDKDEPMKYEDIIGQVSEEFRDALTQEIERAITDGGVYDVTFTQRRFNDGEIIWLRSFGKINKVNGETLFSGFVMDVTQAKKDEQRKNDFIGIVSHELKTPLTSINGYVQLVQRMAKKEGNIAIADITASAIRQLQRMNEMVNGFLDLSRLESGKVVLDKTHFKLDELIIEIVNESRVIDSTHAIELNQSCGVELYADRLKLGSVLSNLLSNAVKYSPHAKLVKVTCETTADEVKICVIDEGIGISKEHIGHLFDRYYRVETKSQISGFGIGLYLSAEVINRHNGKIWAESELDKGSTFCFTLPLA